MSARQAIAYGICWLCGCAWPLLRMSTRCWSIVYTSICNLDYQGLAVLIKHNRLVHTIVKSNPILLVLLSSYVDTANPIIILIVLCSFSKMFMVSVAEYNIVL